MKRICLVIIFVTTLVSAAFSVPVRNEIWRSQSTNSSESMPCGGGDIGMNVWVENGDLLFYLSRSGTFDENNTLLKQGRFRIRFTPSPFTDDNTFCQELILNDGYVQVSAGNVTVQLWTDVFNPVVHVDIANAEHLQTELFYENWRYKNRPIRKGEGQQCSYKWAPPKGCATTADSVFLLAKKQNKLNIGQSGLLFYHRNSENTVFDLAVAQQGLTNVKSQMMNPLKNLTFGGCLFGDDLEYVDTHNDLYASTDYRAWRFRLSNASTKQRFCIVLHTAQADSINNWLQGLSASAKRVLPHNKIDTKIVARDRKNTRSWWNAFWQRSFIEAQGEAAEITRNYTLFRYMLGCNTYGNAPTKFNGGLFTFDPCFVDSTQAFTPDYRKWGGGTMTAQNQRLVYWPMLKSGDFDMMRSQFDFYNRMLPNALLRTKVYWQHNGACFSEQIENYGLPNPAEYGFKRPTWFDKGVEYNAWLEYEWDTVLEFCQMILETKNYSGADISQYLPLIESSLTFFDEHYRHLASQRGRKQLDGNGHLILFPGSACETYKMTNNASNTIAALRKVLETYGHKSEMLKTIPPIPLRYVEVADSSNGSKSLTQTISPAKSWERINNIETPQLYPIFPWRLFGVGKDGFDIARNTYLYDPEAVKFRSHIGWKQDNIWAACLGLTQEAKRFALLKMSNGMHRFPAFWGPGYDWTPDHNWGGSGMIGLQEMLLQTNGNQIMLFPAWPAEWDVHFKLHATDQTTIEAKLVNGKVIDLKVQPENRINDVIIMLEKR